MDMFWLNHEQLLKGVNLGFQRYLSRQVKWDRRLIGIFGAKGVGKTTLLLQRIKLAYGDSHEALYLPLDNIWFQERCMLSETVRQFYEEGGRHLFLDNVHRYGSWVQAIGIRYIPCRSVNICPMKVRWISNRSRWTNFCLTMRK